MKQDHSHAINGPIVLTTAATEGSRNAQKDPAADAGLPTFRLNLMRGGYLLMAVGLIIVKWPLLLQAASMPVTDGVIVCILTAMSLLALLGLRYPIGMLPILLFEVIWKVLWLGVVALPHLLANDMDTATADALQHPLRGRHPGRDPLGLRVEALRQDCRGQLGTNRLMALMFG
jgi:hypothetical protein